MSAPRENGLEGEPRDEGPEGAEPESEATAKACRRGELATGGCGGTRRPRQGPRVKRPNRSSDAGQDPETTEAAQAAGEPPSTGAASTVDSLQAGVEAQNPADATAEAVENTTPDPSVQGAGETASQSGTPPQATPEAPKEPGQPGSRPQQRREDRVEVPHISLSELIAKHHAAAIVIGNGPGVRQVEKFIRSEIRQAGAQECFLDRHPRGGNVDLRHFQECAPRISQDRPRDAQRDFAGAPPAGSALRTGQGGPQSAGCRAVSPRGRLQEAP